MTIANMYVLERYDRATVNKDFYLTSDRYGGQKTRDNTWIAFKHFTHPCVSSSPCTPHDLSRTGTCQYS